MNIKQEEALKLAELEKRGEDQFIQLIVMCRANIRIYRKEECLEVKIHSYHDERILHRALVAQNVVSESTVHRSS
jgi:hypothetical protein